MPVNAGTSLESGAGLNLLDEDGWACFPRASGKWSYWLTRRRRISIKARARRAKSSAITDHGLLARVSLQDDVQAARGKRIGEPSVPWPECK